MATSLRAESFGKINLRDQSSLDEDVVAGQSALILKSAADFKQGDIIYVGSLSQECCERGIVQSVDSSTHITLTAPLKFAHERFEIVTQVFGDQVDFYRAPNVDDSVPGDSLFSAIKIRNLKSDEKGTFYTDPNGSSDFWYKYAYRSSVTGNESGISANQAVRGSSFSHYATLEEIRERSGFATNMNLSDLTVDQHRRAAESEINAALISRYTIPFARPVPELIRHIAIDLAAGFLLLQQYGSITDGSGKDGAAKVKDARALLTALQTNATALVDYQGQAVGEAAPSASSWPNDSTATDDPSDGGAQRIFEIGDFQSRRF